MERVTLHTHTGLTGHGHGTIDELVRSAALEDISVLGITEHYPLSNSFDHGAYLSMPLSRMNEYLSDIATMQQCFPSMEILAGCELDWLGASEDRIYNKADFEVFDIVLGSVHFVDGWAFDDPAQTDRWKEWGNDFVWRRYFESWCDAVCSDVRMDVMAHPDIVKKFGYMPSFDPKPLYRQAVEAAVSCGKMIEVNTSGAYYPCKEMYPGKAFLAEFARASVPCTVGTDAHNPHLVARDIEAAYRWMYEAGYREVTIPLKNGERRSIALE